MEAEMAGTVRTEIWDPETNLFRLSPEMAHLMDEDVISPVMNDPRTTTDLILGYPFEDIRSDAIARGMANFEQTYQRSTGPSLNSSDLVNAYAFVNMRRHLIAAYAAYVMFEPVLRTDFFDYAPRPPLFVDIGCGPGTAGLAFGNVFREVPFVYRRVDVSEAMRMKASGLGKKAKELGVIHPQTDGGFQRTWDTDLLPNDDSRLLINFSYFFGNVEAGAIDSLAAFCQSAVDSNKVQRLALVQINSDNWKPNDPYQKFKERLGIRTHYWQRPVCFELSNGPEKQEIGLEFLRLK
jgi:SAM-dependent methyltransferase